MQSFSYHNPTKVHFGRGVISKLGVELKAMNSKSVLLVYGQGSIQRNGVYDTVTAQLDAAGVAVVTHGGVRGNPVLSHVRDGIGKIHADKIDAICAVGGGSVIDEAKAIAIGAVAPCDVWDFFCGKASPERAIPLVAISTLPATGSEMNGICVVTNEETRQKNALVKPGVLNPKVAFMDPETTMSLSSAQTAFACTDILSHVMEAYFTTSAAALTLQDNLMEAVCRATVAAMKQIMTDPNDYDARAAFMWAATLAWNGIVQAGVPGSAMPCHALEMPLSAVYDVAHGAGLSIVLPAWMEIVGDRHKARIAQFIRGVFDEDCPHPLAASDMMRQYYQTIGSPVTFDEGGINAPDIALLSELATEAFAQRGMTDYTMDIIRKIYNACVE